MTTDLNLNSNYWSERYQNGQTGWDLGSPSPPIKRYLDGLTDLNQRILIPGAGNAYEAGYLFQIGFQNVYICDWSPEPLQQFQLKYPDFPRANLLCQDFFSLAIDPFDLIIEQTFFCAIDPNLREAYANKMSQLLKKEGKLIGLLFSVHFDQAGPPFGGTMEEYQILFSAHFAKIDMKISADSIKPREGRECFIEISKPF